MSLRTDRVSGTITCVFGCMMIGFALFGLLVVAIQRVVISALPPAPASPRGRSMTEMMRALHSVWLVYLPIMLLGGMIYFAAGFYVRRGSTIARRVAQANAVCGFVWIIAYSISCYEIIDVIGPPPDVLPEPARPVFQLGSIIFGALFSASFPAGLLYILSGRRTQTLV